MARKRKEWEDQLALALSTKPAEIMEKACQVLEEHGCPVEKKLKSELSEVMLVTSMLKCYQ